jgi:hypothetical protein
MTKLTLIIMFLAVSARLGHADDLQLLLVSPQTKIAPHGEVALEVYIYNGGQKSQLVPSLGEINTVVTVRDLRGAKLPTTDSSAELKSHSDHRHALKAKATEHRTVKANIAAEAGDLAEVYVEIRTPAIVRSNALLFYCETEQR